MPNLPASEGVVVGTGAVSAAGGNTCVRERGSGVAKHATQLRGAPVSGERHVAVRKRPAVVGSDDEKRVVPHAAVGLQGIDDELDLRGDKAEGGG